MLVKVRGGFEVLRWRVGVGGWALVLGLKLTIVDLANRHEGCRGDDLRLAVAQRDDQCRGDDPGADHRLGGVLAITAAVAAAATAGQDQNVHRRALRRRPAVVQVVEGARRALPEDGRVAQSEGAVAARREARRVQGARLGRVVELELVVGRDVAGASLVVRQHAVGELDHHRTAAGAGSALLWVVVVWLAPVTCPALPSQRPIITARCGVTALAPGGYRVDQGPGLPLKVMGVIRYLSRKVTYRKK